MNLSTRYLGLTLAHPFVAGASPLARNLDHAKQLEDAGAAAIVLHSLFEEQITLRDTGVELVVSVDLPGVAIEDVDVQVSPELLTIRVRETIAVPKDCTIVKKERITGALERTLKLLTRVKPESVQATMELGVLTILLGKARKSSRQMIAVRGG